VLYYLLRRFKRDNYKKIISRIDPHLKETDPVYKEYIVIIDELADRLYCLCQKL